MPRRIRVSMSQEVGLPDAGSLAVSCGVEFDAELSQRQDGDDFDSDVWPTVDVCRQLVEEELGRLQQTHVAACSSRDPSDVEAGR